MPGYNVGVGLMQSPTSTLITTVVRIVDVATRLLTLPPLRGHHSLLVVEELLPALQKPDKRRAEVNSVVLGGFS